MKEIDYKIISCDLHVIITYTVIAADEIKNNRSNIGGS